MLGGLMPNELDSQLLALVNGFEGVCLVEAARPDSLERFVPPRVNIFKEPVPQELLQPVQAGCIALGRLLAGSGLPSANCAGVVRRFAESDMKGLSELAKLVPPQMSERTMIRAAHLSRLFTCGGEVKIDAAVQQTMRAKPPSPTVVQHVALALSAALGMTLRANGWPADEAVEIITSAHRGVLEGQIARATKR
jgi:hypothetical protein